MKPVLMLLLSLLYVQVGHAQRIIVGKVTDCEDEVLTGATIMIKGSAIGVAADENGFYRIELSKKLDSRRQERKSGNTQLQGLRQTIRPGKNLA